MMNSNVTELQAQLERVAKERDELREALGWFLADDRFHVSVGGNPIVVEDMILRARKALGQD